MKKIFFVSIAALSLVSCANKEMIKECQGIAEKEMSNLEGFTQVNAYVDPTEGLKLVIPDEYIGAQYVATVAYESEDEYKTCTCYFGSSNDLLGFDAK